ncbi:TetR/AcrR family transcriptional regulator, partial [Mycobacteroides abscessus]|uniref:TetR/AcrR family transcriptional regulator n=1 Tax=Mycobacteroides abscessus TaxID=36809 RepID=UPI001F2D9CC0
MVGKSSPTSATKLPATAHGRRTRAAIVDAAAQMMYQKGVAATSLDDILAASSTGKSQLYHYFKDRSDLASIHRCIGWSQGVGMRKVPFELGRLV